MAKVKISELPALTPATLDTTFVVGISGSTTYKISINQLTSSLDTLFATDLVTAALSSSLDGKLSTASYSTDSASFNSRIISGSSVAGTISSSAQITSFGFITASTPTDLSSLNTISASYLSFTQSYYSASSSFDTRIDSLENATSSYLTSLNGAISSSTQISDLGFVTGSYTTITSFNSLTQSFNQISQSFSVISGSVGTIDFSTLATTASNTFIGNQTISGSTYISGGLDIKNNGYSWSFESNGRTKIPNITFNSDRGNGMVGIKPVAGREFQIETSTAESSAGPWVFGLDGTLSAPNGANILRVGNLVTTASFNSYTASQSTSSLVDRLNAIESVSGSWITESETGSFLTSLSGAISSSSQLTSSYDTRYTLSSSFSSISSSFNSRFNGLVTTGSNTFSGSQIFSGSMVVTSGQIIASAITNNSSSLFLQSGSNLYVQNNGLVEITGSLNATSITGSIAATNGVISGSTQLTTAFPSKTTGAWSVPAGASTQSFTVEAGASYTMWVNGNIPNGIITWNATVTTSNTNVPVIGAQYGWYYTAGNALVLTAMPDQIIGTTNTLISSPTSYAPNTSNVFKFGITNNSGTTQTINYGYIKLS
jgi:hypothetical protein